MYTHSAHYREHIYAQFYNLMYIDNSVPNFVITSIQMASSFHLFKSYMDGNPIWSGYQSLPTTMPLHHADQYPDQFIILQVWCTTLNRIALNGYRLYLCHINSLMSVLGS